MELALSLGNRGLETTTSGTSNFCMGLGIQKKAGPSSSSTTSSPSPSRSTAEIKLGDDHHQEKKLEKVGSSSPCLQLDLLPFSPVVHPRPSSHHPPLRFPWLSDNLSSEPGSSDGPGSRTVDMNRRPAVGPATTPDEVEEQSSPNSGTSSLMEFSLYTNGTSNNNNNKGKRENGENGNNGNVYGQEVTVVVMGATTTTTSRGSDDEENGSTRKKLRLSKEQSAFLEESFKEHHTLNPKQKLALAKQLNLRPRQVEVWFQNRRARTKLKQTEVDCEYLKRCCETLTEENRRLQKELQELRALKTSQPFFMQLPATTLTMCPSCERVAPTSSPASAPATTTAVPAAAEKPTVAAPTSSGAGSVTLSLGKPKSMVPFPNGQAQAQAQPQAHQAAS